MDSDGVPRIRADEDIAIDPYGDPGQAVKHRWQKAVQRLQRDDESD